MIYEYGDWQNLIVSILMLCAIILIVVCAYAYYVGYNMGYQLGQIDAINGSIHWRLQTQADGSTLWIECQGICEK